ncbi:PH domain-containing protein [Pleionea litopenaei]|uniref:PH domain-containing protein n=1 Tax=Pleionea litopenaei TaxID=3070815 RepID=A0AA51X5K5_9GAMM|nr:PH domain-containing protein [Pleionea sp. HL-JVS1]WMS86063.1 PH domain-containing protein [Pleionea sp. HL-JVS1]
MGLFSSLLGNAGVIDSDELNKQLAPLMSDNENIEIGFAIFRDKMIFTNRRLIITDTQGLTGSKVSYLSIPYSKITKFSIETTGTFDLDAELKIWVGSESAPIERKFNKKVNIFEVQKVLINYLS